MSLVLRARGQCGCGSTTVTLNGVPGMLSQCWCADCQKETGGSPTNSVIVQDDAVEVSGFDLGVHRRMARSGSKIERVFCRGCGATIRSNIEGGPYWAVRVGLFEDKSFYKPEIVLFTKSAPVWAQFPEGARTFDTQPDEPSGASGSDTVSMDRSNA